MSDQNISDLPAAARLYDNSRLEVQNPVTGVNEQTELQTILAQNGSVLIKNDTGAEIPANRAVGFSAYNASDRSVSVVLADNEVPVSAVALTVAALPNGATQFAVFYGIRAIGLDLSSASAMDPVYLGISGQMTLTAPTSGDLQVVARVLNPAANGEVWFDPTVFSAELAALVRDWRDGEVYVAGAGVVFERSLWRCLVAHKAGNFVSDLGSGRWEIISSGQFVGSNSNKPTARVPGLFFFNADHARPEWWSGSAWVGADGAAV